MNSPKVQAAIQKVMKDLRAMSPEEMRAQFEKHQPRDIAQVIEHSGMIEGNRLSADSE